MVPALAVEEAALGVFHSQSAAGEIRPERALALLAVAIPARGCSGGVPLPVGFPGRRIAGRGLRGGGALSQWKQEHHDEESVHGLVPPFFGTHIGADVSPPAVASAGPASPLEDGGSPNLSDFGWGDV